MRKPLFIALMIMLLMTTSVLFLFLSERGESMRNNLLSKETAETNSLEIFSWWTAGGEIEALKGLFYLYGKKFPEVEIVNATIVGGSGANAQTVLNTRMKSGNPPDSFQSNAGPEFIRKWVETGYLEPLTFLYEENNWFQHFPAEVLKRISYEDEIYAIPLNIHRNNIVWYNLSLFQKYDLKPPENNDEFIQLMETLAEKGVTPLALGDKNLWPNLTIFENSLISHYGAENYEKLWHDRSFWSRQNLVIILEEFLKILEYTNSDHKALTWDESVQYLIDGKCAMICIGDFAEGYFRSEGFLPGRDFGWFTYPGTEETFSIIFDIFTLPEKSINRENAVNWLKILASREGQDVFNPIKGSISVRLDSDMSLYGSYLQTSRESYRNDTIVGCITHGGEISSMWKISIMETLEKLMVDGDIASAAENIYKAAINNLPVSSEL